MKTIDKLKMAALLVITLGITTYTNADDTEIYTGSATSTGTVKPNVIFIVDSSGSMSANVTATTTTTDVQTIPADGSDPNLPTTTCSSTDLYDPSCTYVGDCNTDDVYYSKKSSIPSCNSNDSYISKSDFVCNTSNIVLGNTGFDLGVRVTQYTGKKWDDKLQSKTKTVDCKKDTENGSLHGLTGSSTDTAYYPRKGRNNDQYTSNSDDMIRWRDMDDYNLYLGNYLNWYNGNNGSGGGSVPNPGRTITINGVTYKEDVVGPTNGVTITTVINADNSVTITTVTETTTNKKRIDIVKAVLTDLFTSIRSINASVMEFSNGDGARVVYPMVEVTDANYNSITTELNNILPEGKTPLAGSLYEAYLYYKGANTHNSTGQNHTDSVDSAETTFISPIQYQCQKNFVVLLSDGMPNENTGINLTIKDLPGFDSVTGDDITRNSCSGEFNSCLDELAKYMNKVDCSTAYNDEQNVITYTIGVGDSFNDPTSEVSLLLNKTAINGGGASFRASDDIKQLTSIFTSIITEILSVNTTFTSPAISVNAFNRFTHLDELYYAIFKPKGQPYWDGNIKKYRLVNQTIVDANENPAVDLSTGFFKTSSTSYWTQSADAPDGDEVSQGGASSRLTIPRTIYTYTGTAAPSNTDLTLDVHKLVSTNALITKAMLGEGDTVLTISDAQRLEYLKWASGIDVTDEDSDGILDEARRKMGDPLHAKPVLLNYGIKSTTVNGVTTKTADSTLYAATNEGYLHALNPSDGTEKFSFIPPELLRNVPALYDNIAGEIHPYGLDGPLSYWMNDINKNGVIIDETGTLETGEFIYLYQGMRRGGRNYYSLDVTDRTKPKYKWVIKGGTSGFEKLGQTWSEMTRAKVKLNGVVKDVLFFGGGYDVIEDNALPLNPDATLATDTLGRAIYMVDAATGQKLWQAGPTGSGTGGQDPDLVISEMTYSIPANLTVIDLDGDGLSDRIYAADNNAQIFRIDLDKTNNGAAGLAKGGVIAKLGGTTAETRRRFFYAPDASWSTVKDGVINIAIGSGYRAHPNNTTIEDRFYLLKDGNTSVPLASTTDIITESDLYDATSNDLGSSVTATKETALTEFNGKKGWYIQLYDTTAPITPTPSFVGEKVLAKSSTVSGKIFFSTFTPITSSASATISCSPNQGVGRMYILNIEDATPVVDFDQTTDGLERSKVKTTPGIPSEMVILMVENDDGSVTPNLVDGLEVLNEQIDIDLSIKKTYWMREEATSQNSTGLAQ